MLYLPMRFRDASLSLLGESAVESFSPAIDGQHMIRGSSNHEIFDDLPASESYRIPDLANLVSRSEHAPIRDLR